jgi:hypothetical protein
MTTVGPDTGTVLRTSVRFKDFLKPLIFKALVDESLVHGPLQHAADRVRGAR